MRLTGKLQLPENPSAIRAFLIRACINLGIDRLRREQLERRLFSGSTEEALGVAQDTRDAENLADVNYRIKTLRLAILEMSLERRRVFLASCVGGLTSDQISAKSGITKNIYPMRKASFAKSSFQTSFVRTSSV